MKMNFSPAPFPLQRKRCFYLHKYIGEPESRTVTFVISRSYDKMYTSVTYRQQGMPVMMEALRA
ncbi:hypothetical protein CPT76_07785 [Paenibacillus sp. AR247]|nr:hypothetical protein CPT76_07785 [Paenibacillus sp. AR247]